MDDPRGGWPQMTEIGAAAMPPQSQGDVYRPSLFDMVMGRAGVMEGYEQAAANHPRTIEDPEQVAQQGGTSLAGLAGGFFPSYTGQDQGYKIPSDKGGFFNIEDLYRKLGRDIPRIGAYGSSAPSTNNWRLLGMGPGYIMRNGTLINTNSAGGQAGGPASWSPGGGISAEHYVAGRGNTVLGGGVSFGVPNMIQAGPGQPSAWGWPGADQWNASPTGQMTT